MWAPTPSDDDYDQSFFERVRANADARATFDEAINVVQGLLEVELDEILGPALHRLLYANVIAALETYLSDTFINRVLGHSDRLRAFVESSPEFRDRKVPVSDVYRQTEALPEEVKKHLLGMVWHRLGRVHAMYRATLNVEFGSTIGPLARAVLVRHDIVHRNGKALDGTPVTVGDAEVRALIGDALGLVYGIDDRLELVDAAENGMVGDGRAEDAPAF